MSNEEEIVKLQDKIKKAKCIIERAKEMKQELIRMFDESGIGINGINYWDLYRIENDLGHLLNTFRLNLAKLRGE